MKRKLDGSMQAAAQSLYQAKRVLIASHVNPDGDTIGCQLALGLALISVGKRVILINQDGVPSRYQFLPGSELIFTTTKEVADVSVAVDCGSIQQLGNVQEIFLKSKTTIQIDHHDFGNTFGKLQVLEEEASAVGEIVYELIRALKIKINRPIATCLLTSIIVDTGAFRFTNIRPKTFDICSRLMKTGVDMQHLIEESYWNKSRAMARLASFCILQAQYSQDNAVAWSLIYAKDFERFRSKVNDADAVADELRSIEGVKVAALFREIEGDRLRVSMRSRYGINVATVATHFGGGGHHNSAGCVIKSADREKLIEQLEKLVS